MSDYKQRSLSQWGTLLIISFILIVLTAACWIFTTSTFDQPKPKAGIILLGGIDEEGWNAPQYRGIRKACDNMGIELLTKERITAAGDCTKSVQELANAGAGMIFLASYSYSEEAQKFVHDYPQIAFGTNSAECHARNMTSYFIRMYQGRYLAGALAGMHTKTNVIGYVAAMQNSEVNRGINAFALGVQQTNPQARVVVMWTGSWQDEGKEAAEAHRLITEANADVLTYHQDEPAAANVAEELGIDYIGYYEDLGKHAWRSDHALTSVICNWDRYYEDIIRRFLKGELNYVDKQWVGMEAGFVELCDFSAAVTADEKAKLEQLKQAMLAGRFIFAGEIYDRQGKLRCRPDESIRDDRLLQHMDWLVKGVDILE
jgi:basic membrane protein A